MIITERNRAGIMCYLQHPQPKSCPKEISEQVHLMQLIKVHTPWVAPLVWHTVNEGVSKVQFRQKMASAGMVAGVSDVISVYQGARHPSCAIELKMATRGLASSISKDQKRFLLAHEAAGGFAVVAYGAYAGWHAWLDYLGIYDLSIRSKADHLI